MANRLTKFILLTICLLSFLPAGAYDLCIDNIYYNKIADGQVEVTSGDSKYSGDISIPKKFVSEGVPYKVTAIGDNAFDGCTSLSSISIPNSVTSIGAFAFNRCTAISSMILPNSVTAICSYAFAYCRSLSSISIPSSVTIIDNNPFLGCNNIQFTIDQNSEGFQVINGSLYDKGVTRLITAVIPSKGGVEIPNTVEIIGNYAFADCTSLTMISIPNSVTSIGDYAFNRCTALNSVSLTNSVTSIGGFAFYGCN